MFEKKLASLKEARPDLFAKLGATPTEAEVDALLLEAMQAPTAPKAAPAPPPVPDAKPRDGLSDADRAMLHEARVDRVMRGRTFGDLEDIARDAMVLREGASEEELQRVAETFTKKAAKLAESKPKGSGEGALIEVEKDEAKKLIERLDDFFDPNKVAKESFRGLYVDVTGDRALSGRLAESKGIGRFARLTEALSVASLDQILGDSIRRAMLTEYNTVSYLDDWRRIVSNIVPLSDFRTNRRMRLGGYGDLPTVAENGAYAALTSPTDEEATYVAGKKGGKETISLEAIANDDVGFIAKIPQRLARSAKRTLYKAVFDMIGNNSNIYDATALAVAGHNNTTTSALTSATIGAGRLAMNKQAAYGEASQILNADPRFLLVPPDLRQTAEPLILSPVLPLAAGNATEPNYIRNSGLRDLIVVPTWTDVNNWWLVADPADVPTIEVGFYQGRQEPEIFVQDQANVGSLFTNDQIDYKIRFIFGMAVLDFRGFYGAIVP